VPQPSLDPCRSLQRLFGVLLDQEPRCTGIGKVVKIFDGD
jgi:hypothetical protein